MGAWLNQVHLCLCPMTFLCAPEDYGRGTDVRSINYDQGDQEFKVCLEKMQEGLHALLTGQSYLPLCKVSSLYLASSHSLVIDDDLGAGLVSGRHLQ